MPRETKGYQIINSETQGLTKREHFAVMAMQGMLSCPWIDFDTSGDVMPELVETAVETADALIKALNKN